MARTAARAAAAMTYRSGFPSPLEKASPDHQESLQESVNAQDLERIHCVNPGWSEQPQNDLVAKGENERGVCDPDRRHHSLLPTRTGASRARRSSRNRATIGNVTTAADIVNSATGISPARNAIW